MASASVDNKWQKDAADQNFDYMFKLLIIGNSSVGKTSFLFRYADDSFTSAFVSTVGIDFKVKTVFRQDKRVKLQIWVSLAVPSMLLWVMWFGCSILVPLFQVVSKCHSSKCHHLLFNLDIDRENMEDGFPFSQEKSGNVKGKMFQTGKRQEIWLNPTRK